MNLELLGLYFLTTTLFIFVGLKEGHFIMWGLYRNTSQEESERYSVLHHRYGFWMRFNVGILLAYLLFVPIHFPFVTYDKIMYLVYVALLGSLFYDIIIDRIMGVKKKFLESFNNWAIIKWWGLMLFGFYVFIILLNLSGYVFIYINSFLKELF
jgi:hypothetical protein